MGSQWRDLPWVGEGVKNICFVWRVLLLPTFSPCLMGCANSALAFTVVSPPASDQFRWTVSQVKPTAASVFAGAKREEVSLLKLNPGWWKAGVAAVSWLPCDAQEWSPNKKTDKLEGGEGEGGKEGQRGRGRNLEDTAWRSTSGYSSYWATPPFFKLIYL